MTLPIRAFLIMRRGPDDWDVHVCRDLDAIQKAWSQRDRDDQAAVLHLGFDRPHSRDFEGLLSQWSGRMLLTASAIHGLPSDFQASVRPVGFIGELPVHLALTGWGYTHDDQEAANISLTPSETVAHDWVGEFIRQRAQDAPRLASANIMDEQSYQANEHQLPSDVRYRCGVFRFNSLIAGAEDDPCEIARAAPPWLQRRELESLALSARLENVFKRESIVSVRDLSDYSLVRLLRLANFGRTSAQALKLILLEGLDQGPEHSLMPTDLGGIQAAEKDAQRSTLLAQIHRTVSSCDQRAGDILSRRIGLGRASETLQEVANSYGITRERVRQIEAKTVRKIIKAERWDDLLTAKIRALLADRQYPLPVLGLEVVDDWFLGVSTEVDALRYALTNFCEDRVATVEIGGVEYIGFMSQGEWQSALSEAQRTLLYASTNGLSEAQLERLLAPIIPEKAREFRALLWEEATRHCHFSINADGEKILVSHGRGMEHSVQAVLFDAETPLHYSEIAERVAQRLHKSVDVRRVHNAAGAIGILLGRGVYGAEKHLGLTSAQITNIAEEASSIILNGPEGKQWHSAEVLAVLIERGIAENLDKYVVDYCLRSGNGLQGLGRMAWRAEANAVQSSQRLEMRQAVVSVLEDAGKPLSTAELRQRLVALRGVNDVFQFSTADPLIRLRPGFWGLNDRDVPISRSEQRELFDNVVAVLENRQTGIHVSEIPESLDDRWADLQPHLVLSLCNFDQRLKVSSGQFVQLSEWEGPRRQSIFQTVQMMLGELPVTFTSEDACRLISERNTLSFDASQVSACLRSAGAIYDSANRTWSFGKESDEWDLSAAIQDC